MASQKGRSEHRHFALGRTDAGRELAVVFTVRGKRVRVISARPISRLERREYAHAQAESTQKTRSSDTNADPSNLALELAPAASVHTRTAVGAQLNAPSLAGYELFP